MKVTFKLSKDEAESFKIWMQTVKPDQMPNEEFAKQVFFNGVEFLNQKLSAVAEKIMADEKLKEKIQQQGIDTDILGTILADQPQTSETEKN